MSSRDDSAVRQTPDSERSQSTPPQTDESSSNSGKKRRDEPPDAPADSETSDGKRARLDMSADAAADAQAAKKAETAANIKRCAVARAPALRRFERLYLRSRLLFGFALARRALAGRHCRTLRVSQCTCAQPTNRKSKKQSKLRKSAKRPQQLTQARRALSNSLFTQLTQGCGRDNCANTKCASNIECAALPPNEAAKNAVVLAGQVELVV